MFTARCEIQTCLPFKLIEDMNKSSYRLLWAIDCISTSPFLQQYSIQIIHSSHVKITKPGAQKFGNARIMTVHIHYSNPARVYASWYRCNYVISFFLAGPQLIFVNRVLFCTSFYPGPCLYLTDCINSSQLQRRARKESLSPSCRPPAHLLTLLVSQLTAVSFIHPAQTKLCTT